MAAKGLLIAMCASAALFGCAHHAGHHPMFHHPFVPPTPKGKECAGASCDAVVDVNAASCPGGACIPSVDFDLLVLRGRGDRMLRWELGPNATRAGVTFAGIDLDRNVFDCTVHPQGKEIKCKRSREAGFGWFKYTIKFSGAAVPPLDPWVVSEF